jgi:hypothetical protein
MQAIRPDLVGGGTWVIFREAEIIKRRIMMLPRADSAPLGAECLGRGGDPWSRLGAA